MRVGPGIYDHKISYQKQIEQTRKEYAEVAELAREYGVRAVIETHMNELAPSVSKAMTILRDLDPKYVGIMWDPGNQLFEGLEKYEMAIDCAGDYLAEIHAKNYVPKQCDTTDGQIELKMAACPLNEGMVNWLKVIEALKKANYSGWIFLEDFSTDHSLLERLKFNLSWFKKLIQ